MEFPKLPELVKKIIREHSIRASESEIEKNRRIESECIEYLTDPRINKVTDFLKFTSDMMDLIGKREYLTENGMLFIYCSPLVDLETNTAIVITMKKGNGITRARIKTMSEDKEEELSVVFSLFSQQVKNLSPYTMRTVFRKKHPKFDSYITGKKEFISSGFSRSLRPTEAKAFAQRIFDLNKRQG